MGNVSGAVLAIILMFQTACRPITSSDGQLEKAVPTFFRKKWLSWIYW